MLKVLIADDEEKICQLILKLVDWDSLGLCVVATVLNGVEAVAKTREFKPEIIITDIRMPGISGMELIHQVKQLNPDTEFIIISGYRHFEYAHTAIRYGVRNYLLKPIKKEEFRETLKKIASDYREKHEQLNFEERVRLVLKNDAGKLRTQLISQMIYGSFGREGAKPIDAVNGQFHFHFQDGWFQMVGIKFDGIGRNDGNLSFLSDKATAVTRQVFEGCCYDYEMYVEDSVIYLLLNYGEGVQKQIRKGLRQTLDELKQQESILKELKVTVGVGGAVSSLAELKSSLSDARYMIWQRLIIGTGRVLEECGRTTSGFIDSQDFYRFNREFERALESLGVMEVKRVIYGLKDTLLQTKGISGYEVVQMSKEVCHHYIFFMKSKNIRIENEQRFVEMFNRGTEDCASVGELFSNLAVTVCSSFDQVVKIKMAQDNRPIRVAKEYIQKNYMNQVTLEAVSTMVGFAPAYFGTLFKKEAGIPFLEFLQSVRMEEAKKLLVSTSDGMGVICEKVGYVDVKYFTKCFVKYTGLKPGEYRKIYS